MAQYQKPIKLDVGIVNKHQYVDAKQLDNKSRYITVTLLADGVPIKPDAETTAVFRAVKPDGKSVEYAATINGDGTVTAELTQQALAVKGVVKADIQLIGSDDSLLSSASFFIQVQEAPLGEDIESESQILIFSQLTAEAVQAANKSQQGAANAAASAEEAAGEADDAVAAKNAAIEAKDAAEEAQKTSEEIAANLQGVVEAAEEATESATQAAARANEAAQHIEDGLSADNVSYDGTASGLEATNVKDAIDEVVVKMGGIAKVESWEDVQNIVRLGLAPKVFKIGEQLECSRNGVKLLWDVIGFDHDVPTDAEYKHSMTIQLHDCITSVQFDATEAMLYAPDGLAAGTYNFQVVTQPWYTADNGKTFQFTLTQAVPAGGQIFLAMTYNQAIAGKSVKTYASSISTAVIETATVSEGSGGTALGKTDGTVQNLNHIQRIIFGSNRYETSAIRQWINSAEAKNSWWTPQTVFDRQPSQLTSENGFLYQLDADFLAVVGQAKKRTALNTVTDGGGYIDSDELFFLVSRSEVYGGLENNVNEGEPYPYYSDYSDHQSPSTAADTNRIKYRNGSAQYWWLRSPYAGYARNARFVYPSGYISHYNAYNSIGVAPACNII